MNQAGKVLIAIIIMVIGVVIMVAHASEPALRIILHP
jgi:hypothetical protein